jgi:hypothetical protein
MAEKRLPPYIGQGLKDEFLYNPYQVALLDARRQRICPKCRHMHPVDGDGVFRCPTCRCIEASQLIATKAFKRIGIVAGRRSGKTKVGAHAAREECCAPNGLGWILGPTSKILHDSTLPAFMRIIPPHWVKHWDGTHSDLTLINNHLIQFRSLDDVSRGVGIGVWWSWIDEAQKVRERAWDHFRPAHTDHGGNTIFTWTPNGFDWTWRRLWRMAHGPWKPRERQMPGFWMAKCRTIDNPWIQKYGMADVREAKATMTPEMYRQEYEADFVSFSGNVYDWEAIEPQILQPDDMSAFIPEWPNIASDRITRIGLGGGITHPFAAVILVATDRGLVVIDEYKHEHRSAGYHHDRVIDTARKRAEPGRQVPYEMACAEDKQYVFTEFNQRGTSVMPTDSYLMTGVQRAQSWIYSKQLFVASTCEHTLDQLRGYRWHDFDQGDERTNDDETRDFLKDDELPKALQAAVLSYPELPKPVTKQSEREMNLPEKVRRDIERVRQFERGERDVSGDDDHPDRRDDSDRWPMEVGTLGELSD